MTVLRCVKHNVVSHSEQLLWI